jgi:hypothetical protein
MLGFDCKSFDKVLKKFALTYSGHTPFNASGMIVELNTPRGNRERFSLRIALGLC